MSEEPPRPVYIVDDDPLIRKSVNIWLSAAGYQPQSFACAQDFIDALHYIPGGCVLLDIRMPDLNGLRMLEAYRDLLAPFAVIVITGYGDISTAVEAMKIGAVDFIEKPFNQATLIKVLSQAFADLRNRLDDVGDRDRAVALISRLTQREGSILKGLLAGMSNKVLARELDISPRTVEMHRANMMKKLEVHNLSDALKIGLAAEGRLHSASRPS